MDINTPLVQEIRFWSTKKDKPKNQILFFSAISFTLVLVPVTFTILTLCADFPQSVADFHKSKTKKILSIPKCWVGRFRSELVKSNACLRFNRQRYWVSRGG